MKYENEITVLVTVDYETLNKKLLENNFSIKEKYQLNDIYMIPKNLELRKLQPLDILQKCVIIREIIGIEKELLYKYKKYKSNGDIIEQRKIKCSIKDVGEALEFMEAINYKSLFNIFDQCIVYSDNSIEITIQIVNNTYIFIEMEDHSKFISKKYKNDEEMIRELEKYDIPYEKGNYFVKKAEIMLKNILKN